MNNVKILSAREYMKGKDGEIADTRRNTPNGTVPYGLAGYTHDGAAYCPDCADDVTVTSPNGEREIPMPDYPPYETDPNGFGVGIVDGMSEADYGMSCDVCLKLLDTQVLVYE